MFPNLNQYYKMKYGKKTPVLKVSKEEFIRLAVESGVTKEKAESQANFSKGLGANTMIGNQRLQVE